MQSALAKKLEKGLALSWQNEAGYWFACGPVQCTQAGSETEKQALDYVINEKRHEYWYLIQAEKPVGVCHEYTIKGMEAYDFSEEKVRRLAKCTPW